MSIQLTTTSQAVSTVNCLVYGPSGVGKTRLAATCEKPVVISSEDGLMSLKDEEIPVIMVKTKIDFEKAYYFVLMDPKCKNIKTVVIDSISDIAQMVLTDLIENPPDGNADPRAAYGNLAKSITTMVKKFRGLDKNLYVIAQSKMQKDDYDGVMHHVPSLPGNMLGNDLPYIFDLLLPMRTGETEKGKKYTYLQTESDMQWAAKDRSGKLNRIEKPRLGQIFKKIMGECHG